VPQIKVDARARPIIGEWIRDERLAMKSVLVVYGTTEGQTRKIAEFVADALKRRGVKVELVDSASEAAAQVQPVFSAAIVCGSIHQHRYQASLLRFVKQNRDWLVGLPAAFVCVSLASLLQDGQSAEEQRAIEQAFHKQTGWTPAITRHVAGALRHPEHDYLKRLIMRLVARHQGVDVDTSRDREYTDWDDLARFVDEFLVATSQQESGHSTTRLG
jgi:menaquinone-dependent protoporphyrinogen oxidase